MSNPVHATPEQRHALFAKSPIATAHQEIRDEVVSELHLEFEHRASTNGAGKGAGLHAVCAMCKFSVAQLTDIHPVQGDHVLHEISFSYTLDTLATLYMAHFMQRHYDQEGRKS